MGKKKRFEKKKERKKEFWWLRRGSSDLIGKRCGKPEDKEKKKKSSYSYKTAVICRPFFSSSKVLKRTWNVLRMIAIFVQLFPVPRWDARKKEKNLATIATSPFELPAKWTGSKRPHVYLDYIYIYVYICGRRILLVTCTAHEQWRRPAHFLPLDLSTLAKVASCFRLINVVKTKSFSF